MLANARRTRCAGIGSTRISVVAVDRIVPAGAGVAGVHRAGIEILTGRTGHLRCRTAGARDGRGDSGEDNDGRQEDRKTRTVRASHGIPLSRRLQPVAGAPSGRAGVSESAEPHVPPSESIVKEQWRFMATAGEGIRRPPVGKIIVEERFRRGVAAVVNV